MVTVNALCRDSWSVARHSGVLRRILDMGTSFFLQLDPRCGIEWLDELTGFSKRSGPTCIRYKEIFLLIPVMLLLFSLSTPFDFSWAKEVKNRENIIGVTEAVSRMEQGNNIRRFGLMLLGCYGIIILSKTKNSIRINSPEGAIVITYLGWSLLSLIWSIDPMFTLRRVVTLDLLWLAAIATAARYSLREIAILTVGVCGITAVLAFANELRLHTIDVANPLWRFSGIFHTVAMGWNCGLLAIASAYLMSSTPSAKVRRFLAGVILMAFVFLLLTKSRMALASTIAALMFFWMTTSSRENKSGVILAIICVGCLCYLMLGDQLLSYLGTATTLGRGQEARESVGNLTGRLPLWKECFRWASMQPILGYGFNTFISPKHYATIALHVGWNPSSIHSGYIDAILGIGYPGFLMLISFLGITMFRAIMLARHFISYSFTAAVMIWLCYNLFLEANLITRPTFMTFIALTIIAHFAFMPRERALIPAGLRDNYSAVQ